MKTYCIGTPGQPPRVFMTAEEDQVSLNVHDGEVYFNQANFPPSPSRITDDGTALVGEDQDVAISRSERWAVAKLYRDSMMSGGCDTPKGRVDTDPDSQRKINGSVTGALVMKTLGQPFSVDWTMHDNSVVTHNGDEMITMGLLVLQHISTCQGVGETIRGKIEAATTNEEIAAVDIKSGYPA